MKSCFEIQRLSGVGISRMSQDFDWTTYISHLGAMPPLVQLWEIELVAELQRYIPKRDGLKILEIGCSNGRWLRWFKQEYGAHTFGVDLNPIQPSMVENFVLADGLCLPIRDGTFDVVFSMGLVEHFSDARLRHKVIAEHVRAAKPQTGLVWLEHPNMNFSLDWLYVKFWYDYRQGYRHYSVTDRETKRHFQNLGVEILRTRWIGWLPPRLLKIVTSKLHKYFSWLPTVPDVILERKRFEHALTADNFLIIGRRI